jgi:hypothetical protein
LYFSERKATGIVILYVQLITFSFIFHRGPDFPKLLLPFRVCDWNRVCIFNFSNSFLLSHLSHCLSVHSPPTFTDQYKSCSSPLYNSVHLPATPSVFRPNISLIPFPPQNFRVYSSGTQTLTIQHTILYYRNSLFITLWCEICVNCLKNCKWYAVFWNNW